MVLVDRLRRARESFRWGILVQHLILRPPTIGGVVSASESWGRDPGYIDVICLQDVRYQDDNGETAKDDEYVPQPFVLR